MKLQTMLLPTGEFILVASEAPLVDLDTQKRIGSAFFELRTKAGAAGAYITDWQVEVVDALVDPQARRRDDRVTDPTSWLTKPADLNHLFDQIQSGRDFTPAGLVVGEPGDPDLLADPELLRGGEPGADPEPDVIVADSTWETAEPEAAVETLDILADDNAMEAIAEAEQEVAPNSDPYKPAVQIGDWVKILRGLNGKMEAVGAIGRVVEELDNDGDIRVELFDGRRRFASEWELAQEPELRPNYADDTQLVDIVARAIYDATNTRCWTGRDETVREIYRESARRHLSTS